MTDFLIGLAAVVAAILFFVWARAQYRRARVTRGWTIFGLVLGVPAVLIVLLFGGAIRGPLIGVAGGIAMAAAMMIIVAVRSSQQKYYREKSDEYMRKAYPNSPLWRKRPPE